MVVAVVTKVHFESHWQLAALFQAAGTVAKVEMIYTEEGHRRRRGFYS
jgi:hypothetical protein